MKRKRAKKDRPRNAEPDKKRMRSNSFYRKRPRSAILALAGGFRLLLPLHGRLLVMLALTNFLNDACFRALPLETAQCTLQRFIVFYSDFTHLNPSLRFRAGVYFPKYKSYYTARRKASQEPGSRFFKQEFLRPGLLETQKKWMRGLFCFPRAACTARPDQDRRGKGPLPETPGRASRRKPRGFDKLI